MKVHAAGDGVIPEPNCIYVNPSNKNISLLHGALHVADPAESHGHRRPIDIFFRSLAGDRKGKSIAVILSGMGSDGSLGLKAIKEHNGVVLVQNPATAHFDGMPRSATEAVIADIVAPAGELPEKLLTFLTFTSTAKAGSGIKRTDISALEKIMILLRERSGHDFSLFKKTALIRCIERRKAVHQIETLHSYVRFLQEYPEEIEILFKELLIGVTRFFRDTAVWEKLKRDILPGLIDDVPAGSVLRAWVTGCSTGEEAYSLAITVLEALEKAGGNKLITLQIFATDLDHDAIETARQGVFATTIAADVSPERISRFFSAVPEGYRVNAPVRDLVVFAQQNVITAPPFTRLDILTCRNVLIYMEPELQTTMMARMNYALKQGGILLLGMADAFGRDGEGFEVLDATLNIYKRTVSPEPAIHIHFSRTTQRGAPEEHTRTPKKRSAFQSLWSDEELKGVHDGMQILQENLQAANENLQAENEELQSTNEELTTSMEEIRSLSEELSTVNAELRSKLRDAAESNDDMAHLLNSTQIAALFLDSELHIRRFTESAVTIFRLRSTDIGRPFTDLVTDLQYPEMESHARQVQRTLLPIESSVSTFDGRRFFVRILPCHTLGGRVNKLVITCSDITLATAAEDTSAFSESRQLVLSSQTDLHTIPHMGNS